MRWDSLFDDLEAQLERERSAEELALQLEDERLRLARLGMRERLVAIGREPIILHVGSERHRVRIADAGRDWLAVDGEGPPAWSGIVPLPAIDGVTLAPPLARSSLRTTEGERPSLTERLGLAFVLRDLCRRRRYLRLETPGAVLSGTIDRVGRDHLDLALHPPDAPRRESALAEVRMVPLDRVRLVRLA